MGKRKGASVQACFACAARNLGSKSPSLGGSRCHIPALLSRATRMGGCRSTPFQQDRVGWQVHICQRRVFLSCNGMTCYHASFKIFSHMILSRRIVCAILHDVRRCNTPRNHTAKKHVCLRACVYVQCIYKHVTMRVSIWHVRLWVNGNELGSIRDSEKAERGRQSTDDANSAHMQCGLQAVLCSICTHILSCRHAHTIPHVGFPWSLRTLEASIGSYGRQHRW